MNKNKQTLEQIREKCESELVDIIDGTMNLSELYEELKNMKKHSTEYVIILMERDREIKKYKTTLYVTQEDSKNYK